MTAWCVADMDDGILIVRPTRRECVQWAKDASMATRVIARHAYGDGAYEYTVAADDPEDCASYFIGTLDAAEAHGWARGQEPLYGDPENPHLRTATREDEA